MCCHPSLWKEVPGEKVLFAEEVRMALWTGKVQLLSRTVCLQLKSIYRP